MAKTLRICHGNLKVTVRSMAPPLQIMPEMMHTIESIRDRRVSGIDSEMESNNDHVPEHSHEQKTSQ